MPWRGLAFLSGAQQIRLASKFIAAALPDSPAVSPRPAVPVTWASSSGRDNRRCPYLRRQALSQPRLSLTITALGPSGWSLLFSHTIAAISPWHRGPSWRCHFGPFARRHQHLGAVRLGRPSQRRARSCTTAALRREITTVPEAPGLANVAEGLIAVPLPTRRQHAAPVLSVFFLSASGSRPSAGFTPIVPCSAYSPSSAWRCTG
jgi:hypothetical protein